jgi:potassium/hydrogen antiporter
MDLLTSYNLIIEASVILILSFIFGEIARKTNVPSVLMLIALGIGLKFALDAFGTRDLNFLPVLEVLGIVGLIMIVLEAALELELTKDKLGPITQSMVIALLGLMGSAWAASIILQYFIPEMTSLQAWLYATPISILSSAIIIPSVTGLTAGKREFHIYESTFGDILGIMLFYYLAGKVDVVTEGAQDNGLIGFFGNIGLTIAIALVASYGIVFIFQNIKSHVKLFLLIAVLLLVYSLGKKFHLSSLLVILIFGLVIANMRLFFQGKLGKWLHLEKANQIYEGLHVVTGETAFVVRTFFFVIFGLTISLASLANLQVALISGMVVLSIYVVRLVLLKIFIGGDILPQLFIAPRGLVTVLLFYDIPTEAEVPGFEAGILLFVIIATSFIMTFALVWDKRRTGQALQKAKEIPVGYEKWEAPVVEVTKNES